MNLSESTGKWLVTTITSYLLIALFVAANLANPLITLDPTLSTALLIAGLAGLGITGVAGYRAVAVNGQLQAHNELKRELSKNQVAKLGQDIRVLPQSFY